jgi:hypothetical protein
MHGTMNIKGTICFKFMSVSSFIIKIKKCNCTQNPLKMVSYLLAEKLSALNKMNIWYSISSRISFRMLKH